MCASMPSERRAVHRLTRAHNPEVAGSNPAPATRKNRRSEASSQDQREGASDVYVGRMSAHAAPSPAGPVGVAASYRVAVHGPEVGVEAGDTQQRAHDGMRDRSGAHDIDEAESAGDGGSARDVEVDRAERPRLPRDVGRQGLAEPMARLGMAARVASAAPAAAEAIAPYGPSPAQRGRGLDLSRGR